MTLQPLAATDRSTPVGVPEGGGPFPLDESALFIADYDLLIPPEAVPFEQMLYRAAFRLQAQETTCGVVTGILFFNEASYLLDGSTFAMQDASIPDAYRDPVMDCAGTHASPL